MQSLELFSGAGGMAKGLELAGFEHSAFIEFNKDACRTLRANFDPGKVFELDVRNFDFAQLRGVSIVAGGPPCQPFSMAGKHKSSSDSRDMFPEAIRAITLTTPKAFVFENVKGLLRESFAEYFEYIILRLTYPELTCPNGKQWTQHLRILRKVDYGAYDGVKYRVQHQLVNAADFGVPQKRERVVIVGVRSDLKRTWSFPKPTHSEDRLLWEKYVTGEYSNRHGLTINFGRLAPPALRKKIEKLKVEFGMFEPSDLPWLTVRDALRGIPEPYTEHSISDHVFQDGARSYPGHTGSEIDNPAKTIKAGGHGVPGGENMIRFEDGAIRYFSIHEAKLIQTFPHDFDITGSWGEALRQIGNAVPVELARRIGDSLFDLVSEDTAGRQAARIQIREPVI